MGRVQFGLIVPENPQNPPGRSGYLADVDRLLAAVAGHYDSAWCIDHLQGDVLEGWTAVTYLAARHPGLRWGHTVLAQSFRNPALVAKMGATLQFLSGGRFVLGIGAGGQEAEYRAYGYAFPPGRTRVAELNEALHIIKALWTEGRATFAGQHYRVEGAECEPKPDPTWGGGCLCAPTEAEVADFAAERLRRGADATYQVGEDFVGTPAQVIAQMRPFVELGVDYFMLDCGGFPRLTTVELLIQEVLPALNS